MSIARETKKKKDFRTTHVERRPCKNSCLIVHPARLLTRGSQPVRVGFAHATVRIRGAHTRATASHLTDSTDGVYVCRRSHANNKNMTIERARGSIQPTYGGPKPTETRNVNCTKTRSTATRNAKTNALIYDKTTREETKRPPRTRGIARRVECVRNVQTAGRPFARYPSNVLDRSGD